MEPAPLSTPVSTGSNPSAPIESEEIKIPIIPKPKSKITLILGGIAVAAAIAGAGFLVGFQYGLPPIPPAGPTPTLASPTPTPTDFTAAWQTYQTMAGLEFKYPAQINVCDFQNSVYLESGFKSLCQDEEGRKKTLLTEEELKTVIEDFKNRINNKFTEVELSIEYDGDRSKITSFSEIINENKTNIFAWFEFSKGYYFLEILGKDKDVSLLFEQILSTFKFLD